MGEHFEPEEKKISNFNSAGLINIRLHELFNDANNHKRKGYFKKWNSDLDAIWCELAGDVEEDGKEEEKIKALNKKINQLGILSNSQSSGFNGISAKTLKKRALQYNFLLKKEIYIRRIMNDQGKGTSYRDDSSYYMD